MLTVSGAATRDRMNESCIELSSVTGLAEEQCVDVVDKHGKETQQCRHQECFTEGTGKWSTAIANGTGELGPIAAWGLRGYMNSLKLPANAIVKESILTGDPKGYEHAGAAKPKSDADLKVEQLSSQLAAVNDENAQLKRKIAELEARIVEYEGPKSKTAAALENAKVVDGVLNE